QLERRGAARPTACPTRGTLRGPHSEGNRHPPTAPTPPPGGVTACRGLHGGLHRRFRTHFLDRGPHRIIARRRHCLGGVDERRLLIIVHVLPLEGHLGRGHAAAIGV